jgi:hypothetical protein
MESNVTPAADVWASLTPFGLPHFLGESDRGYVLRSGAFKRHRLKLAIIVCIAAAAIAAAPAFGLQYFNDFDNHVCVQPGEWALSGWQSSLTWNAISTWGQCGPSYSGLPAMGTSYMRTDNSTYPYLWSTDWQYGVFDSRTISYGMAICRHGGNLNGTEEFDCTTSG